MYASDAAAANVTSAHMDIKATATMGSAHASGFTINSIGFFVRTNRRNSSACAMPNAAPTTAASAYKKMRMW
jgi:hypothetical protein